MSKLVLVALLLLLGSGSAFAHGGQYSAPSSGGSGGKSAADAGGGGSLGAPPTNPMGASAPGPSGAPAAGPASRGDAGRSAGRQSAAPPKPLDLGSGANGWESWWDANKDGYLDLRNRVAKAPRQVAGLRRQAGAAPGRRPDQERIDTEVLPFLLGLMTAEHDRDVLDSSVLAVARSAHEDTAQLVISAATPLLAHDELSVQTAATLALGVLGSPRAVGTLTELMSDSSPGRSLAGGHGSVPMLMRSLAALSLGLLNDEASVGTLCGLIGKTQDSERDLKVCSIVALGLMDNARSPEATSFLLGLLADPELTALVKSYVPTALGKLCSRDSNAHASVVPQLLEHFMARDTHDEVRQSIAIALGRLGQVHAGEPEESPAVQALIDYITAGRDAGTRHFCFIALARIGGRDEAASDHVPTQTAIRRVLQREISKPSTSTNRPWAMLAAALYGRAQPDTRAEFAGLVQQAYASEKNPSVRAAGVLALGLLEVSALAPVIFDDFNAADDAGFRGYAALSLGFLSYDAAAETLQAECRSKTITPSYRMQVVTALGLLADQQTVGILAESLGSAQTLGVSAAVAKSLGLMGDESSVRLLMDVADDESKSTLARAFACIALGMVCEQTNLPWNQPIMADNNYNFPVPAIAEVCDIL